MAKAFFYNQGLENLSNSMKGNENIYLGIRPYGFHAGNKIPFLVYPYLICKHLEARGIAPALKLWLFINDWEQDAFDTTVVDNSQHPFNVIPKFTTFQFTGYADGGGGIVDYWETEIIQSVLLLKKHFSGIQIRTVRNSHMRDNPAMKDVVLKTISNPQLVRNVLQQATGKIILDTPLSYCKPICPKCRAAKTESTVHGEDEISLTCTHCGLEGSYNYHLLHYWLYHKPLALPRIQEFKIDICITGGDHYREGDFDSRSQLFKAYGMEIPNIRTLYTPTLVGRNGLPMGKSKGNYEDLDFDFLLQLIGEQKDKSHVYL